MYNGIQTIDCNGLDLLKGDTPQTITGLYKKVQDAMTKNVEIIATNCIWGTGKPITPISVFAIQIASDTIICTASTLQIVISAQDVVVIENMAPSN